MLNEGKQKKGEGRVGIMIIMITGRIQVKCLPPPHTHTRLLVKPMNLSNDLQN